MANKTRDVLNLLEVFCRNNRPMGITELSNILLEGKSSIFQKIKALEELEYIEQDEHTRRYALTTKLLENEPVYRCRSCGFSGRSLHWQCPSCKQWNTVKPIHGVVGE